MTQTLAYYVTLLRTDFAKYCNEKLQELGLSQGLLFFILYVGKHPNCSPKELAQSLHMDTGHVTRSLAKLEQSGFLCQECNPNDRRARILQLCPKGAEAFSISHELFEKWDNTLLNYLSPDECSVLLSLLKRLADTKAGNSSV